MTSSSSSRTLWQDAWRRFRRDRMAVVGTFSLVAIAGCVVFGPWVYRTPIDAIDFGRSMQGPSWVHFFGTNDMGQDVLARILSGGRISLTVGVTAMVVAVLLGTLVGAIAGFCGGFIDTLLMRVTDVFLALPQLPLLLLVMYLFQDSVKAIAGSKIGVFLLIVVVIGSLNWMSLARLVRAEFLTLRSMEFVMAARSLGASPWRIVTVHLLPNVLGTITVAATLAVGTVIITESTLSFLGLGFPPDVPTWGRMLYDARNYLETAPHMAIFPGAAIFLTVLSINFIGDGLRDAIDPKR
ncbi:MAG: ABC transporter permease [Cyanobacteria bacterium J055]|nr:MAG: ABC transporter permease [Cyanobacteria bacterium J055]